MNSSRIQDPRVFQLAACFLIATLGILLYANHLRDPFQFDTVEQIQQNHRFGDPSFFFTLKFFKDSLTHRPILLTTFAWNLLLAGMTPFSFHLTNLLLHLLDSILVFFVVQRLFSLFRPQLPHLNRSGVEIASLICSLFFLCHPIQTESVVYITSRSELLAAFFYLGGFLVFLRTVDPQNPSSGAFRWLVAPLTVMLAFVAGILSKQSVATLPLMLFLCYAFSRPAGHPLLHTLWRGRFLIAAGMLILLVPLFHKLLTDERFLIGASNAGEVIGRKNYMLAQPGVVVFHYLRLLIFPFNLNVDPDIPKITPIPEVALALTAIAATFLLARMSAFSRLLWFSACWYFIVLSPSSSIITLLDMAAEHRVYLASLGFFIPLSLGLVRAAERARDACSRAARVPVLAVAVLTAVFLLGATTADRCRVWNSELGLWTDALKKSPHKVRPIMNIGHALLLKNRDDEAFIYYQRAIGIDPYRFPSQFNIGTIYEARGQLEEALEHYRLAALISPHVLEAHNKTGEMLMKTGKYQEAEPHFRAALVKDHKKYAPAFRNLGVLNYYYLNRQAEGLLYLRQALALDPNLPDRDYLANLVAGGAP